MLFAIVILPVFTYEEIPSEASMETPSKVTS